MVSGANKMDKERRYKKVYLMKWPANVFRLIQTWIHIKRKQRFRDKYNYFVDVNTAFSYI